MKRLLPLLLASAMLVIAVSASAQPYYAPGDYVVPNWDPATSPVLVDDGTGADAVSGDGIFTVSVTVATAGVYNYKLTDAPNWDNGIIPPNNAWFITTADNQVVTITYNTNAQGDGWAPDQNWTRTDYTYGTTYTLVGDLGSELGVADWDPGSGLFMHDDGLNGDAAAGDGIFSYLGALSTAGSYNWKVAVNGGWGQQFGGEGPTINADTWGITVDNDGDEWLFELNTHTGRIRAMYNAPVPVQVTSWGEIKATIN